MNTPKIAETLATVSASELRFPVEASLQLINSSFSPEILLGLTDRHDITDFILDNTDESCDALALDAALEDLFWFDIHFCN